MAKLTGMRFGFVESPGPGYGPRCEANVVGVTAYWRRRRCREQTCDFRAVYVIDGKRYCRLHAGVELIRRAEKETDI